jgi:transposase
MPRGGFHSTELPVQVLTLWSVGFETPRIMELLGLSQRTVQNMIRKGKERGFRPEESYRVKLEYVEDGKRSRRPAEITEAIQNSVIAPVTADRAGREDSSEILAYEAGISHSSVLCILHRHGLIIANSS